MLPLLLRLLRPPLLPLPKFRCPHLCPPPLRQRPAPAPTPVAYQQSNVHVESATQSRTQIISQDERLADAARRAKQHKACLDLAKDNPSITCN